jgi:NADH-quinone oxidoreductase subunit K
MSGILGFSSVAMLIISIGIIGIINRKNIFVIYMSVEIMLNGVNLLFAIFAKYYLNMDAQVIAMLIIAIAAAEAALFLAVIVLLFKHKKSLDVDIFNSLNQKGL